MDYHREAPGKPHEYYDDIVRRTAEAIESGRGKVEPYDAILVDEGQDFDDEKLRVVRSLLREGSDLLIALDTEQDLYHARRKLEGTRKSLGINVQGHVTTLKRSYRSTDALREFSSLFAGRWGRAAPAQKTRPEAASHLGNSSRRVAAPRPIPDGAGVRAGAEFVR